MSAPVIPGYPLTRVNVHAAGRIRCRITAASCVYDQNGNLTQVTDQKSQTTTVTYDGINRPTAKAYADGSSTALTWHRIDWPRKVIEVRAGWREGQPTRLKTAASQRDIDLLPSVRKALETQRVVAGGSELVFCAKARSRASAGHD